MNVHVETLGAGDDLVLLHGWGMHGGVWDALKPLLAARFRLHLVDLPGHGASSLVTPRQSHYVEMPSPSAISQTASPFAKGGLRGISAALEIPLPSKSPLTPLFQRGETNSAVAPPLTPASLENLAQEIAAATPPRAHWCGWSLGGLVALAAARRFPQRIGKLALVAATPCFVQRDGWDHAMAPQTLHEFAGALENAYEDTLKRFLSLQARGDGAAKAVLRALREHLFARGRPHPAALRGGLDILLSTDARPWVAEVTHPVLIVHGERDQLAPLPAAEWLAHALPDARLETFPDAAHAPFLSHPHEFAETLSTFLNG